MKHLKGLLMLVVWQLAGKPLIWEHLGSVGEDKWHTALQPKLHDGKHSTMSMDFNTSLFTVLALPPEMPSSPATLSPAPQHLPDCHPTAENCLSLTAAYLLPT